MEKYGLSSGKVVNVRGVFMCNRCTKNGKQKGYTLVELLVVIAIMGILSAMGVAGLQGAVENKRVSDVAQNTSAFLLRVANEANRRSDALCLKLSGTQRIEVYIGDDCTKATEKVDQFEIESPMKFITSGCPAFDDECETGDGCTVDWLSSDGKKGVFKPKLGLSAAPASGFICAQYGSANHYAASLKKTSKNSIESLVGDDEGWDSL